MTNFNYADPKQNQLITKTRLTLAGVGMSALAGLFIWTVLFPDQPDNSINLNDTNSKNSVTMQKSSNPQDFLEKSNLNPSEIALEIDRLERRIQTLENSSIQPQNLMEKFAVKLCEYHGGNAQNSSVNPCLDREYFQRQASALAPHYEKRINECLSAGKGNACLEPKTYLNPPPQTPEKHWSSQWMSPTKSRNSKKDCDPTNWYMNGLWGCQK
ncbi:hypothetical protein ACL6C3_13715 [Capilliphycus salinus ALCB114379]|uniref:hypothetical protein n=1 Tax=Capilliphycus salinus TaxID=2768948 RepID=UPI0039A42A2D